MRNYYDELEVSKTASKDVIEKVYKVLAKKYHPDTTTEIDKVAAEEKFKIISEAYEILSNNEKRKKYNIELEQSNPTISYAEYLNVVKQRDALNHELHRLKNSSLYMKYNNKMNANILNNSTNKTNNNYSNPTYNADNSNNQKKVYYCANTKKSLSVFDHFKYKVKKFFTNLGILLLSILIAILIFNTFSSFNIFRLFIK